MAPATGARVAVAQVRHLLLRLHVAIQRTSVTVALRVTGGHVAQRRHTAEGGRRHTWQL